MGLVATGSAILGNGVGPNVEGLTVVRIRGELLVYLVSATALADGFNCAFGIGITSAQAFAIGVTAVDTPISEAAAELWMYHRFFSLHAPSAAEAEFIPSLAAVARIEVDSKAMRKFAADEILYAAIEVVELGTAQVQVDFNSRVLVKLP